MAEMKTFFGSTAGLICSLMLAALGAYLLVYHLAHVALAIPYLFLLACPLMHFMLVAIITMTGAVPTVLTKVLRRIEHDTCGRDLSCAPRRDGVPCLR